ncbi:hypothetical protein ACIFOT_20450 [Neobacillus sp. NRS-1170]|uniref:hypothetical protein n=1 Tax=Neobacillus sp. NRS-1170 TaxID=3233898 RepID=UPI003D2CF433
MIKKILYSPVRLIAILAGFVCVVNIPILFVFNSSNKGVEVHFSSYKYYVLDNLALFLHYDDYSYIFNYFKGEGMEKYAYTMTILSISLLLVVFIGILAATAIMLLPHTFRKQISNFIDFTITAPDLLIIFLLQYMVIYIYKTFDVNFFSYMAEIIQNPISCL